MASRSAFVKRMRPHLGTWGPALVLLVLLVLLASLQVRWLEQMRVADAERTRSDLEARLQRVADDFNRQLGRLFVELQPLRQRSAGEHGELPERLATLLADWRETAPHPDLVASAFLIRPDTIRPDTIRPDTIGPDTSPPDTSPPGLQDGTAAELTGAVWRLEPLEKLASAELPQALRDAALAFARHAEPGRGDPARGGPRSSGPNLLIGQPPALIIPLALPPAHRLERGDGERDGLRTRRRGWRRGRVLLVGVLLESNVLVDELLADLVGDAFGAPPSYRLRLVRRQTGEPIAVFGPPAPPGASVDARAELFGPIALDRPFSRRGPRSHLGGLEHGLWRLEASHPAGSLARAIKGAHRRNLAVSLGILAILAAALVLLARGAARSRRLARQQLDFVAGITHELMTPLAALRSAGQNLADGVVGERSQIERYGRMIDSQGQRLGELVGQVLAFSRMQSGQPNFRRQQLDAAAELEAVLEQMGPTLEDAGVELEVRESGRPRVLADSQALRRALSNLISNAVKYGQPAGQPAWIGCSVTEIGNGSVAFEIADRGSGISARDRPHLFEPFYRGRGLAAGSTPGSGLGLALVRHLIESQGGRVEVRPCRPGAANPGAVFRLILPAAAAPEDGAEDGTEDEAE